MSKSTIDLLANAAVSEVESGMVVGLGTGRAAARGIVALAAKVKAEGLAITCVATSGRSAAQARELGLTVLAMREVGKVNLLFDGVDELNPDLAMTKGGGGAMTWEKIVAEAATRRIYLMQRAKLVEVLGEKFPLPIEVLEFGLMAAQKRLAKRGIESVVRLDGASGKAVRTDEGNLILDGVYGDRATGDLRLLDAEICAIPGVVGHGLFVDQADVVFIESDDGDGEELERRERG